VSTVPASTPAETETSTASVPTAVNAGIDGPGNTGATSGNNTYYLAGLTLLVAGAALIGIGATARLRRGKHMA